MTDAPLWISEAEVEELLTIQDAIDALASVHEAYAAGGAQNMVRTHATDGAGILHAVGGIVGDVAGTKTWMHTPGGARPLLVLLSPHDGSPQAIVEAFSMGQLRTAGTSGLGTRLLARRDSSTLALAGTGRQALAQAQAVAAVRPIDTVRIVGRDAGRRAAFAERLAGVLDVETTEHARAAEALEDADVVSLVTRAAEPIVSGTDLRPGVHVNAVGSIVRSRRELDAPAVGRCDVVVVDSAAQARRDSGELIAAVDGGLLAWDDVRELGAVSAAGHARDDREITLLKALGVGIADVAIGAEVVRRARLAGAGTPLPRSPAATANAPTRRSTHV